MVTEVQRRYTVGMYKAISLTLDDIETLYYEGVLKDFRNPYDNKLPALRSRTGYTLGQVSISAAGMKLQFETCFEGTCGPLERQENLINIDDVF